MLSTPKDSSPTREQPESAVVGSLIIGAGMCGLTIAQELLNRGDKSWLIVDKGRSVGGRMATRRLEGQRFDHGAQFFTVRSPLFKEATERWLRDGIIKEWTKGFQKHVDGHSRYIGSSGMNQLAKQLASNLPTQQIVLNEKIITIAVTQDSIVVASEGGFEAKARAVVITTPIPQSLDLIESTNRPSDFEGVKEILSKVAYNPCIAIMGFFDSDELPLLDLPIQSQDASISFLADNFSKGLSTQKGALTIHLSSIESRRLFDTDDKAIVDYVCNQLQYLFKIGRVSKPSAYSIQRWRYASPITTISSSYLEWSGPDSSGPKVFFAGEAFSGAKVEGAFLSGHAVAQRRMSKFTH
jgi:renalase